MKLEKKKEIVEDLHDRFLKAKIVITTDYKGLNDAAVKDLRRKLHEESIDYKVVKNTLLTRASENTEISVIKDDFVGPCAIAISYDDPVTPAKILTNFAEENPNLEVKVAAMNGSKLDGTEVKALSKLPSKEVLLGQLLSIMNGVPTNFVRVLNAIPGGFVNVLQAIKDKKGEE